MYNKRRQVRKTCSFPISLVIQFIFGCFSSKFIDGMYKTEKCKVTVHVLEKETSSKISSFPIYLVIQFLFGYFLLNLSTVCIRQNKAL